MIILASKSQSRQTMLTAAGVEYHSVPANIDERSLEQAMGNAAPSGVATALAATKARAVSADRPDALVLGSDSLIVVDGKRFDKPENRTAAAEHLRLFSGKQMELHSAAALARGENILWQDAAMASLQVRELSDEFIESYLQIEWPAVSGCVGVFRIEAMGVQLFERIDGDQFTVLGMPLLLVLAALRDFGELPR